MAKSTKRKSYFSSLTKIDIEKSTLRSDNDLRIIEIDFTKKEGN